MTTTTTKLRGMPRRFMEGAPEAVRKGVIDLFRVDPPAPLEFDVVLRETGDLPSAECIGLDFGDTGLRGCHFFLKQHEMRAYRERNRNKRVAWKDLPEETKAAILAYLSET